ncbi:hypothetical protein A5633_22995 [Mycolicibacterium elephantis]|uniref:hypothetical protein n=1 Tax=Mycolicibacterium elephantis TaxID=81858 RepID=UPI0007E95DF6|nr:hypothetical protein [Mycolicibacterium elephantis]OBA71675.1 hypothetical protein A5633_22995 [Mycolicibacterium elephantis]
MSGGSISPEEFASYGLAYDDVQLGWIRSVSDQDNAAAAEARRYDNTEEVVGYQSERLEDLLRNVMRCMREKLVYVQTDKGGSRPDGGWNHRDLTDPLHYNGTGIYGVMAGRMAHTQEAFVFLVTPGAVREWLADIDIMNSTCGVNRCAQNSTRFMDKIGNSPQLVIAARQTTLYAMAVCAPCLAFLRYEDISGS